VTARALVLAVAVLASTAAGAQDAVEFQPRKADDPAWVIGRILYYNGLTRPAPDNEQAVNVPSRGDVRFRIDHTYNIDCPESCPDTITVTAVPDGVGVDVDVIDAAEESWTTITVYDPDLLPQG
jgi:hypothetical protein